MRAFLEYVRELCVALMNITASVSTTPEWCSVISGVKGMVAG